MNKEKEKRIKTMIIDLIHSDNGHSKTRIINIISKLDNQTKLDVRMVYERLKKGLI